MQVVPYDVGEAEYRRDLDQMAYIIMEGAVVTNPETGVEESGQNTYDHCGTQPESERTPVPIQRQDSQGEQHDHRDYPVADDYPDLTDAQKEPGHQHDA